MKCVLSTVPSPFVIGKLKAQCANFVLIFLYWKKLDFLPITTLMNVYTYSTIKGEQFSNIYVYNNIQKAAGVLVGYLALPFFSKGSQFVGAINLKQAVKQASLKNVYTGPLKDKRSAP